MVCLAVFLVILIQEVSGDCHLEPWADDLLVEAFLDFTCESGQYLECDNADVFTSPSSHRVNLAESCGIRLKCINGTTVGTIAAHSRFFSNYVIADRYWIEIDSCSIQTINFGTLSFPKPEQVYMSFPNNELHGNSGIVTIYTGKLQTINMSRNSISSVNPYGTEYRNLRYLDLSRNKIVTLSANFLKELTYLKWISLRHNQLKTIPHMYIQTNYEVKIFLNDNNISQISDTVFDDVNIDILDLSFNQLIIISKRMLASVKQANTLCFRNNKISGVEPSSFSALKLLH